MSPAWLSSTHDSPAKFPLKAGFCRSTIYSDRRLGVEDLLFGHGLPGPAAKLDGVRGRSICSAPQQGVNNTDGEADHVEVAALDRLHKAAGQTLDRIASGLV